MACCAHVWIYHAILTPIPRRLRRPRPRSKSVYYEGNLKEISEFDGVIKLVGLLLNVILVYITFDA
jgi:hypothetical protein